MNRFIAFEESHTKAKECITRLMDDEDPQVKHIVNWLFTTEHNPHSIFYRGGQANCMYYAEGFAALCRNLNHALVDDGHICFPVINGEPLISFEDRFDMKDEDWFSSDQLRQAEFFNELANKYPERVIPKFNTVTFLHDAFQFTAKFEAKVEEHKKKCAAWDEACNRK